MRSLLSALCLCAFAEATTLVRYDLEGLTHNAAAVLLGTCRESSPRLIGGQPHTLVVFEVGEVVKGQAGARLELCLPGGEHQGMKLHLAGMPEFAPGEEAVLFLTEPDRLGHPWPVGLGQGKFRVERRPAAKPRVFQQTGEVQLHGAPGASLDGMELEELLARVRRIAGQEAQSGGR
ncbi:MAG: hypothetical protein FJY95_17530 [Candidatus Handelsmanbacteria bacterium]|nr:hypothetical protein [Candidatus Handelsmanbacteria bacterium]